METRRILAHQHVIPALGARKLVDLSAEDVDRWLAEKARSLTTRTIAGPQVHPAPRDHPRPEPATRSAATSSCCAEPRPGRPGAPPRPSTPRASPRAGRTRERIDHGRLRAGVAAHRRPHRGTARVDLEPRRPHRQPDADPPVPPHIHGVALSPRRRGHQDPQVPPHPRAARTLRRGAAPSNATAKRRPARRGRPLARRRSRLRLRQPAPRSMRPTSGAGSAASPPRPGSNAAHWTPRELRHSFVSLLVRRGRAASSRSPASSGIPAGRQSPRPSTASNCARSSTTAPPSWTASSAGPTTARPAGRRDNNSPARRSDACTSRRTDLRSPGARRRDSCLIRPARSLTRSPTVRRGSHSLCHSVVREHQQRPGQDPHMGL